MSPNVYLCIVWCQVMFRYYLKFQAARTAYCRVIKSKMTMLPYTDAGWCPYDMWLRKRKFLKIVRCLTFKCAGNVQIVKIVRCQFYLWPYLKSNRFISRCHFQVPFRFYCSSWSISQQFQCSVLFITRVDMSYI